MTSPRDRLLLGTALALALAACAAPPVVPAPEAARVVFLRPSMDHAVYNFPILDAEGNVVALAGPASQTTLEVAPGRRHYELVTPGCPGEQRDALDADLAPGKPYYVLVAADATGRFRLRGLDGDAESLQRLKDAARVDAAGATFDGETCTAAR